MRANLFPIFDRTKNQDTSFAPDQQLADSYQRNTGWRHNVFVGVSLTQDELVAKLKNIYWTAYKKGSSFYAMALFYSEPALLTKIKKLATIYNI